MATISVALSVAIITIASVITSGFQQSIDQKLRLVAADATLTGFKHLEGNGALEYNQELIERLEKLPYIEKIYPQTPISGALEDQSGGMCGVILLGVDSLYEKEPFSEYITQGEFDLEKQGTQNKIIISEALAKQTGAKVSKKIDVMLLSAVPISIPLEISAIFNTAMAENDEKVGYISLELANSLSSIEEGWVANYKVLAPKGISQEELLERFENEPIETPLLLTTTQQQYPYIYDWLSMLDNNVQLLVIIMLVVAGFNMVCAVLILILEQTRTIGVFKSLGMQDRTIQQIFLRGSMGITLKGAFWGAIIATSILSVQALTGVIKLDPHSYMIDELPLAVEWGNIVLLNSIILCSIILFTLLPTFIISRISPSKTLKFS
ncbi:MAG: FtsX-like permease family protein [Rikenellaceae bacterium]